MIAELHGPQSDSTVTVIARNPPVGVNNPTHNTTRARARTHTHTDTDTDKRCAERAQIHREVVREWWS